MTACSFDRLLQFANGQVALDERLEIYDHLDRCDICRDAVFQLMRDRDEAFLAFRALWLEPPGLRHSIKAPAEPQGAYR